MNNKAPGRIITTTIEGHIYGLKFNKNFEGWVLLPWNMYNQVQLLLFHDIWSHLSYFKSDKCMSAYFYAARKCVISILRLLVVNGVKGHEKCSNIDRPFLRHNFLWNLESWFTTHHFKVNFKLFPVMLLSQNTSKWSHQNFMNMPNSSSASNSVSYNCKFHSKSTIEQRIVHSCDYLIKIR